MAYAEATPDARIKAPPSGEVWWIGVASCADGSVSLPVLFAAKTWFEAREKAMKYFGQGPGKVWVKRQ